MDDIRLLEKMHEKVKNKGLLLFVGSQFRIPSVFSFCFLITLIMTRDELMGKFSNPIRHPQLLLFFPLILEWTACKISYIFLSIVVW